MVKLIAYFRVSPARQGQSGLRLDVQRAAVEAYAARTRASIVRTFTELENGKCNTRPELVKAVQLARATGATLAIAKLDRLSRNAVFLLTLRDSGIRFLAADMPDANHFTVGIMALVAQQERETVSKRTREALAAAKRRGVALGNPNGARALRRARQGNVASLEAIRAKADAHAANLRPVVESLAEEGITSLAAVASELNERGMLTPRGGRWHKSSVKNLLARL